MTKHVADFHIEPYHFPDTNAQSAQAPTSVEHSDEFDAIIDVRSPAEFAEDHIYGAINCPALNNDQRAEVGTLYKHNPFEGRKLGAAYISDNMSVYLRTTFADHKKYWRPLVYCWRGGMRSNSIVHIMQQVGWPARQLHGGYKAYRHYILSRLETLPLAFTFIVLCGPTGSGKSRLLNALVSKGHQVLDLEDLACHRGSLLGLLPGKTQPSQRYFETCLHKRLSDFSTDAPIYIESESKRIGQVTLPPALFQKMQESPCLNITVPLEERIRFLCEDYHCYIDDPRPLRDKIRHLAPYHAKKLIEHWLRFIDNGEYPQLVEELLKEHYDPLYWRSTHDHHPGIDEAPEVFLPSLAKESLEQAVETLVNTSSACFTAAERSTPDSANPADSSATSDSAKAAKSTASPNSAASNSASSDFDSSGSARSFSDSAISGPSAHSSASGLSPSSFNHAATPDSGPSVTRSPEPASADSLDEQNGP